MICDHLRHAADPQLPEGKQPVDECVDGLVERCHTAYVPEPIRNESARSLECNEKY